MIFAAISAFPSPTAVKHFVFAALTTGKENVMRSGGGFGESAMGRIQGDAIFNRGCSGNSEQMCPSGPNPSNRRSNTGSPSEFLGRTSLGNAFSRASYSSAHGFAAPSFD
eukprot:30087-Pelagococcus_subviridis.AAC.34